MWQNHLVQAEYLILQVSVVLFSAQYEGNLFDKSMSGTLRLDGFEHGRFIYEKATEPVCGRSVAILAWQVLPLVCFSSVNIIRKVNSKPQMNEFIVSDFQRKLIQLYVNCMGIIRSLSIYFSFTKMAS